MNSFVTEFFNEIQPVFNSASMIIDYATETIDASRLPVDIVKTDTGINILVDMPGYVLENIKIQIVSNVLTINATRYTGDNTTFLKQERSTGSISRSIKLDPFILNSSSTFIGKYNNGVLTIFISLNSQSDNVINVTISK